MTIVHQWSINQTTSRSFCQPMTMPSDQITIPSNNLPLDHSSNRRLCHSIKIPLCRPIYLLNILPTNDYIIDHPTCQEIDHMINSHPQSKPTVLHARRPKATTWELANRLIDSSFDHRGWSWGFNCSRQLTSTTCTSTSRPISSTNIDHMYTDLQSYIINQQWPHVHWPPVQYHQPTLTTCTSTSSPISSTNIDHVHHNWLF